MVGGGLRALEVYHPDHDEAATARYRELARRFDLVMTGGSDYHGAGTRRAGAFGRIVLPAEELARLRALGPDSRRP
jgi:hypothetical protein